ncbi:MAG: ABC-F family ATP-binding cassette domain-containing protein [Clostridia bacterium]|nr:ABC-F family ATP-binding cassette domain-containing protein [Clostridia bacterium]
MIAFGVSDLGLSFGGEQVLSGVTFSVNEGDRLGIIGVNGAGKTSLFRCLTGEYTPTEGSVFIAANKTVGMLSQHTDLSAYGEMTPLDYLTAAFPHLISLEMEIDRVERALAAAAAEEVSRLSHTLASLHEQYSREGGLEYRGRCASLLARMGFGEETAHLPLRQLSGGQQTRLSLARLLAREPDILLLDEPTNHLDIDALTWLEDYLASYRHTLCIISHDRYFLDRVTNKTLHVARTGTRLYPAPYSRARQMEEADAASLDKRYKEQQKEIARIRANIEFQRRCGQEHNFVTIRSKEKQLARMDKVERAAAPPRTIRLRFGEEAESAGNVLEARGLSFSYGSAPVLSRINLLVRRGECVLFLGANGCGKSTLLKLIVGELTPTEGVLELGYNIKIGYYDQENRGLCDTNTVIEELRAAHPAATNTEIYSTLALFLFMGDDVDKRVGTLSGGERARLSLAKLVLKKVNLLILDEPTNHLDIGSREALETALGAFGGTVLAVSHDRYFISRLASRIIELDGAAEGGYYDYALEDYDDAYEAYLTLRERRRELQGAVTAAPTPPSEGKAEYEARKRAAADVRNAEKRKERAAARAALLEAELARLEEELFGSAASDYVRAAEIQARRDEIEEELLSLYEQIL